MMFGKIFTIIIIAIGLSKTVYASEQNIDGCAFIINFERGEPSTYVLQGDKVTALGLLGTFKRTDLDGKTISQKGITLDKHACLYDIKNKTFLGAKSHDTMLKEMIIPTFYNDEFCQGKLKEYFRDGESVAISIQDAWFGHTNHYARDFALILDDIKINDKWMCAN